MVRTNRRRRRSSGGQIVGDTSYIANRLPWQWVVVFGAVCFTLFFWGVPALLAAKAESVQNPNLRAVIVALAERRGRWSQWVAMAIALVCVFFAVRNYWISRKLVREGERNLSLLSRFIARWLD